MTINQIMPLIDKLPHEDKLQLIQNLLSKIAAEENITLIKPANQNNNNIVDLLAMPNDIEFEPPRLNEKLYHNLDLS
jgi:hypothetical protein